MVKKFTKEDLDYYLDNFQVMDRASMVLGHLYESLYENPIVPKNAQKKIKKAYQLLLDVYQEAGSNLP